MADAAVRVARPQDAAAVAQVQLDLWRDAYADLLPPSVLRTDPAEHADRWHGRISTGGPVLIAAEGRFDVGFAALDLGDLGTGRGEIETLGVLPNWARRGHGGRLLAAAAERFRRADLIGAYWWAPEPDRAVAAFLRGAGWTSDQRRGFDTGERVLTELRWTGPVDLIAL